MPVKVRARFLSISLVLVLFGLSLPQDSNAGLFDPYWSASIIATRKPTGDRDAALAGAIDVHSAANARVYDWQGNVDFTYVIVGAHYLDRTDIASTTMYSLKSIEIAGEYNDYVRKRADPGECYRGYLEVSSGPPLQNTITRGSAEVCADGDPASPIIIDLDSDGFHLTGVDHGVWFDLDVDGQVERVGWTRETSRDAFLCQDRDRNGSIDDGSELFGDHTPSRQVGPSLNGYYALAELDLNEFGGNDNDRIDPGDVGFADLCVWLDKNHNGISETSEIFTLQEIGVTGLRYDHVEQQRRDAFGNLFRYKSGASIRAPGGTVRSAPTYDVFLVTTPPEH
jgi:hypothetical protein